jgi:hypothetical protein
MRMRNGYVVRISRGGKLKMIDAEEERSSSQYDNEYKHV